MHARLVVLHVSRALEATPPISYLRVYGRARVCAYGVSVECGDCVRLSCTR